MTKFDGTTDGKDWLGAWITGTNFKNVEYLKIILRVTWK